MSGRLVIVDYDPSWPILYHREREAILGAIGERLVAVEHVGSTAVPGLGAKPIVDLLAGLPSLNDAQPCIPLLAAVGYEFVPAALADLPDDRYFEKWSAGVEVAHLHLTQYGSTFWRDHLLFREFLRTHPDEAREYEQVKRELAPRHTSGRSYSIAKTAFIRAALTTATAER